MQEPQSPVQGSSFDLTEIARELRGEGAYVRDGHTARTLVREADLRVVLVAMRAGAVIKEHQAADTASIQTLGGHLRIRLPDRVVELSSGRLLVLERGLQHNVEAIEESTLLLTLGWRAKSAG
jgi:quercetin dioxygenase-like cupin family protein